MTTYTQADSHKIIRLSKNPTSEDWKKKQLHLHLPPLIDVTTLAFEGNANQSKIKPIVKSPKPATQKKKLSPIAEAPITYVASEKLYIVVHQ